MTCSQCGRATCFQKADHTGLLVPLCEDCELPPRLIADGTQPGNQSRWVAMTEQISVEQARVEACKEVLRHLVQSFARELSAGYTTPEQQSALRAAKELIG